MSYDAKMKLNDPDEIEVTLKLTMPVHAWRRVSRCENWNPFREAVGNALMKVEALSTTTEVQP